MTRNEELALAHGYSVDPDGRIHSPFGRIIRGHPNYDGYRFFAFYPNGKQAKRIKVAVARLQAVTKFGAEAVYREGIQVRHLDGNPSNNKLDNIAIGTASENQMDKPLETRRRVSSNANRKHDHAAIIAASASGVSYNKIMATFGIKSKGTISFIVRSSMGREKLVD